MPLLNKYHHTNIIVLIGGWKLIYQDLALCYVRSYCH